MIENRFTVLRIAADRGKCLFHGDPEHHPLDRVQEWLTPVWTPTMHQCSRCLTAAAGRLRSHKRASPAGESQTASATPQPQSFWIAAINGNADVLQVGGNGVQLPGCQETYPLPQVSLWIMPVWGPEMAYCSGCSKTKPRADILFFFRGSRKGVCKDCSDEFDLEATGENKHA